MKRHKITPRADWQQKVEALGLEYHSSEEDVFWDESVYYELSTPEVLLLEKCAQEFHDMTLEALQHIAATDRLDQLGIPFSILPLVMRSMERNDISLFTRFDIGYDGKSHPKLLYCQADCPFLMVESEYIQWSWKEEVFPEDDQFNEVEDHLKEALQKLDLHEKAIHFVSAQDIDEQYEQIQYLESLARDCGATAVHLDVSDVTWSDELNCFIGARGEQIEIMVKYYPWELLLSDEYGPHFLSDNVQVVEPAWKLMLSSNGIFPVLWELFPNHPGLLEAYFEKPSNAETSFEALPLFPQLHEQQQALSQEQGQHFSAKYALEHERVIYREPYAFAEYEGNRMQLGLWMIGGKASGVGFMESSSPDIYQRMRFVPHCVRD